MRIAETRNEVRVRHVIILNADPYLLPMSKIRLLEAAIKPHPMAFLGAEPVNHFKSRKSC